jgi:hypothetical protein
MSDAGQVSCYLMPYISNTNMETRRYQGRLGDKINELVMAVKLMAIGDIASGIVEGEVDVIAKQKLERMLESAKEKGDTVEIISGFEQAIIRVSQVY